MPIALTNSINMAFETFGNPEDTCLVLIMGLGEQMVAWPDNFCRILAYNGFFAVRLDNRDAGLSSKFDACGIPDLNKAWAFYYNDTPITSPYTLKDMAADVKGLLDWLKIEKVVVCGFSLGAMIAQNMAFAFPDRMIGMVCMGSSTGARGLPAPSAEAQTVMASPPPQSREDYIDHATSIFKAFSGGSLLYDKKCRAEIAALSFDRCFYPQGFMRQSVAMLADGSRKKRLESIQLPTLVLQGELDPIAQIEHGLAIRDAVPNASFSIISKWGHGLDYPEIWPQLIRKINDWAETI
ncbi:MAG: alpha/beta hydrolase [Desulfobacterales bacterium]|nr:alpha/beta hydrolase [Desulfobacterales bacterium]